MRQIILCDNGEPEKIVELCLMSGFGIELQSFYQPEKLVDEKLLGSARELAKGVAVKSMHGPFGDLCPGSFDWEVRALARKRFEQAWSAAKRLEAAHMVLHHGYVPNTSPPEAWLKRWPAFWRDFLDSKDGSVKIHIENHLDLSPKLLSEAVALVGREDSFDINLDIGHVNFASKIPAAKWIERLKGQIGYVHLHDNHGSGDEHLGLGQGSAPLEEALHALEECAPNAIWAIEAPGDGVIQSLDWLQAHGFLEG